MLAARSIAALAIIALVLGCESGDGTGAGYDPRGGFEPTGAPGTTSGTGSADSAGSADAGRGTRIAGASEPTGNGSGDNTDETDPAFVDGVYFIVAALTEPLPVNLTMAADIRVGADGAAGLVIASLRPGEDGHFSTADPSELFVDTSEEGVVAFGDGRLTASDGETILTVELQDMPFHPVPSMTMGLHGGTIVATAISSDGDSSARLDGVLTFDSMTLSSGGSDGQRYPTGSTVFQAPMVHPDAVWRFMPRVCGSLCDDTQAHCAPPGDFPPEDICDNVE